MIQKVKKIIIPFFWEIFKNPFLYNTYNDNFLISPKIISEEIKSESKKNDNIQKKYDILFTVIKEDIKEKKVLKKRGKQNLSKDCKKYKIHKFDSHDNILRKINSHFLSFIVLFLNEILNYLNYPHRFIKLNYKYKKKVNKKYIEEIKNETIGDIICKKISGKYKKLDVYYNKIIYGQIKDNIILKNIMSERYLDLFKKIYHKGSKIINLKEYGLNKEIILSNKVKMYKDLLLNEEKKDLSHSCRRKYNECIKLNFIPNSIFISN